jgi:hypothetical protein
MLGAAPGDAVLLRVELSQAFVDHLGDGVLTVPRMLIHPQVDPASRLQPFGWSREAIELNRRHEQPVEHPQLDTIRRVNSRSFGVRLEAEIDAEEPMGTVVESVEELCAFLAQAPPASGWVVKSEHGNSGLANRRLRAVEPTAADLRVVQGLLDEDDRIVVEPWLQRERDWCVVFDVPFDSAGLRIHETLGTRDGALIGALFEPGGPEDAPTDRLGEMAQAVASKLEGEGYFGPVCVDAFNWRSGDRSRLRRLVDLNCRRSMSDCAYRLWQRVAPEQCVYYRFFNRRKLSLPVDVPGALSALQEQRYDPERRSGVLLASPPEFGKLAVMFFACDRREIFEAEQRFRSRFEG